MKTTALLAIASVAVVGIGGTAVSARSGRQINVEDRCDPVTFNAALGDGACAPTKRGTVTFDRVVATLNPVDFGHDAWRFNNDDVDVRPGETITLPNTGGEFHTFTEVAEFGGGCVPDLNVPLGVTPIPECEPLIQVGPGPGDVIPLAFVTTGIAPGGRLTITAPADLGTYLYQCLIHPWMRAEVHVHD